MHMHRMTRIPGEPKTHDKIMHYPKKPSVSYNLSFISIQSEAIIIIYLSSLIIHLMLNLFVGDHN
jgi:hypothetical protein